ncbi:MAG: hypothetical protein R2845_06045 [Thermomicrobiales bacterium]
MRRLAYIAALVAFLVALPASADAHPADRLLQHLVVTIYGDRVEATFAVGGGFLATSDLAAWIDIDGDQEFSELEAQQWLHNISMISR